MVVSEEYQYIIIAVEDKLHVYKFDLGVLRYGRQWSSTQVGVKILGAPQVIDL